MKNYNFEAQLEQINFSKTELNLFTVKLIQTYTKQLAHRFINNKITLSKLKMDILKNAPFLSKVFDNHSDIYINLISQRYIYRRVLQRKKHYAFTKMIVGIRNGIENAECEYEINKIRSDNRYVSTEMLSFFRMKRLSDKRFLNSLSFINKSTNQLITSLNIDECDRNRFNEYYMQVKALEALAQQQNKSALFITLTCPPKMHPNPKMGNNSYDGTAIVEACHFLNHRWRAVLRRFSQYGIKLSDNNNAFGFKIIEPHQDGCPHLHILLFTHESNFKAVVQEVAKACDYRDELTKNRRRTQNYATIIKRLMSDLKNKQLCKTASVEVKHITEKQKNSSSNVSTAASYLSKYLSKHLSSNTQHNANNSATTNKIQNLQIDESKKNLDNERVQAWRYFANVRAFSMFGIKSKITIWRSLRKVENKELFRNRQSIETKLILLSKGLKFKQNKLVAESSVAHIRFIKFLSLSKKINIKITQRKLDTNRNLIKYIKIDPILNNQVFKKTQFIMKKH